MPDDDVDLLGDVVLMQLHPTVRCLAGSLLVDRLDVVVGSLQPELVGHLVLGVVLEDVEDEAFLDGLAHRVAVERFGQQFTVVIQVVVVRRPEQFEGFLLRGCRERQVRQIGGLGSLRQFCGKHGLRIDLTAVLHVGLLVRAQHRLQLCCCRARL